MPANVERRSLAKGVTLAHWSNNLEIVGLTELADQLRVTPDPYASAKDKNLPVPPYFFFSSPATFLRNPQPYFADLKKQGVTSFFANLRPKEIGLPKHRQLNLTPDEAVDYVKENLQTVDPDKYNLLVAEYRPAIFGGTMIINPDGDFAMELVKGEMGDLAIGHVNPDYTVGWKPLGSRGFQPFDFSDSFTGEDLRLRKCAEDVLIPRLIVPNSPRDTEIALREINFRSKDAGYYEYSFLPSRDGDETKPWDVVYFDYNSNPAFYLQKKDKIGMEKIMTLHRIPHR